MDPDISDSLDLPDIIYTGYHIGKLDEKFRVSLPAHFREIIIKSNHSPLTSVYLAVYQPAVKSKHPSSKPPNHSNHHKYPELTLIGEEEFTTDIERMLRMPGSDLKRQCFFSSEKTPVDKLGRINLRNLASIINAEKGSAIAFVGNGAYIRVLNDKHYREMLK